MGFNGYSKKFDPKQFKPSKIIIATDSDPDGSHITTLVFGLFLRYLPFVIEQGKLYSANPPLYGIQVGKNMKFFANNVDYIEYVQGIFCKETSITNLKGKAYTKKEITKILYNNMDYVKYINHVSSMFSINPYLLEFLLYNRNLSYAKFKKAVEKAYPFTAVSSENGTTMVRGLVDSKYQTVFFNQRLINDCKPIIDMIDKSDEYYIVNGVKTTIYGLMLLFGSFEPKNLTRYKGLGEMPPKMLGESTIIPGHGRILKQYTIDDVKKELSYFTDLQSDKSVFIKNIGNIRKEDIV